MKTIEVIKAVTSVEEGKLASTFAMRKWRAEYTVEKDTFPKTGFLFAYATDDLKQTEIDMGGAWLYKAEADVVGAICREAVVLHDYRWTHFWKVFELAEMGAERYLLCSRIRLIERISKARYD